MSNVAES